MEAAGVPMAPPCRICHLPPASLPRLLSRAARPFDPVPQELRPRGLFVPRFRHGHGNHGSHPFPSRQGCESLHLMAAAALQPGVTVRWLAGNCRPWRGAGEDLSSTVPPHPSLPAPGGAAASAGRDGGQVPGLVVERGSTSPALASPWGWQPLPWVLGLAMGTHASCFPPRGTRRDRARWGKGALPPLWGSCGQSCWPAGTRAGPAASKGEGWLQEPTHMQKWGNLCGVSPPGAGGRRGLWP